MVDYFTSQNTRRRKEYYSFLTGFDRKDFPKGLPLTPILTWGCNRGNLEEGLVVPRERKPSPQCPVFRAKKC